MAQGTAPVILLAFTNSSAKPLAELETEYKALNEILKSAQDQSICEIITLPFASLDELVDTIQKAEYHERLAVIHIAGHGNEDALFFQTDGGGIQPAYRPGFVGLLAGVPNLQVVFLNACSTLEFGRDLCNTKVPIVIATLQSISDPVAVSFAERFYKGLSQGASIGVAFAAARDEIISRSNGDYRNLYDSQKPPESRVPWEIFTRAGADRACEWNLPAAAGNPLYGLPALPESDLPATPYRYLERFTSSDAEVFFGRGEDIRDLYKKLTENGNAPILLFYGQSGVGKSSLLEAGLLPRLSRHPQGEYQVVVRRREQKLGTLGTLTEALRTSSGTPTDTLHDLWLQQEKDGKRLVIILDQLEEIFTRPVAETVHASPSDELDSLIAALKAIFDDPANRPGGKLVLSFRKEWLSDIREPIQAANLYFDEMILGRLSKKGVIEAVAAPARNERLQRHYHLIIQGVNDNTPHAENLPQVIADDLDKDDQSNIALVLQILLSKLWDQARVDDSPERHFDRALYNRLSDDGLLVEDFLRQTLEKLKTTWKPEIYETGLPLDVLEYHTTILGTAEQHSETEIRTHYAHQPDLAVAVVNAFKERKILTDLFKNPLGSKDSFSRLAHDALAPVVRREFQQSPKPGQRARRALERRVPPLDPGNPSTEIDAKDAKARQDDAGVPLDNHDLRTVETGLSGMRALYPGETELVAKSKVRRRISRLLAVLAGIIFGFVTYVGGIGFQYSQTANALAQVAAQ
ncbi:MAG: CHAT domain-containing protein, partial [Chloroflexota bacterium]